MSYKLQASTPGQLLLLRVNQRICPHSASPQDVKIINKIGGPTKVVKVGSCRSKVSRPAAGAWLTRWMPRCRLLVRALTEGQPLEALALRCSLPYICRSPASRPQCTTAVYQLKVPLCASQFL